MELNRYASDYSVDITKISFSYLLELAATLREYYDSLVLIGGWVPYFILQNFGRPKVEFSHIGSIDIDLAVDPKLFSEGLDKYRTIIEHIENLGYTQRRDKVGNIIPSSFIKHTKYDIYTMITYYKSGPPSVAEKFKPYVEIPVVSESIKIIDKNFEKLKSNGPVRAGYFLYPNDTAMREKAITDAYMNVREFLKLVR